MFSIEIFINKIDSWRGIIFAVWIHATTVCVVGGGGIYVLICGGGYGCVCVCVWMGVCMYVWLACVWGGAGVDVVREGEWICMYVYMYVGVGGCISIVKTWKPHFSSGKKNQQISFSENCMMKYKTLSAEENPCGN